jgi:4a-hydroxytetrahydrobiopterin dehydratase
MSFFANWLKGGQLDLADHACEPCTAGGEKMTQEEALVLAQRVPEWTLSGAQIERNFTFKDFRQAIRFVNQVADLAEEEGHHPDITIYYSKVRLTLSTHKVGGLTHNDFILAAKIDRLVKK